MSTTEFAPLAVGSKIIIEKGCNARGVTKGASATIKAVEPLGAEYGYAVRVTLGFLNTFLSGKTISFYVRHENRLKDAFVNMNDGRPEHKITVRRRS
jgi:hypothetical protein